VSGPTAQPLRSIDGLADGNYQFLGRNYQANLLDSPYLHRSNLQIGRRLVWKAPFLYSHDVGAAPLAQRLAKSSLQNAGWIVVLETALSGFGI
jgi:hypothetical protein